MPGHPGGGAGRALGVVAEPLTRPLGSSSGTPPFAFNPTVGVPETPPEPPFAIATLGRGSRLRDEPAEKFSGAAAIGQKATRNRLEHSLQRRHYFMLALFLLYAGFISAKAKGGKR